MAGLFDPITLGAVNAPNRILMAPLTRGRATQESVPTPMMGEYYAQRASAGLIISEATGISREGLGWAYAPGLWTDAQVEGWKPVLEKVHKAGGRIVAQLWHMGRLVHPDFLGGEAPLSSSATQAPGSVRTYLSSGEKRNYGMARAATLDDIKRVLDDYARATQNALDAGFDGVQLHAANGYLIDQFLRDNSNLREDEYGGSPENRARLLREAIDRIVDVAGGDRTSVRFSPNGDTQGVVDSNPEALFLPIAQYLSGKKLAFVELREPGPDGTFGSTEQPPISPAFRKAYNGVLVLNQDFDGARAREVVESGAADAVAFGRPFLANPDLPARLEKDAPLNKDDMPTWYSRGPEGYTDYPTLQTKAA
ncbi:alkene reductase [Sphingomonas sp. S1-29]|uniref:alkene reductase n=1 Tax=Sphingomonas sp. S1-29 TaxID=2991074 RepID=UPI00223FBA44|nr:alkene reductase [Sphingomonas sp. S1-29]UZK68584.1 alkene reductase [Sphingomonas sp. S1-29]